MKRNIYLLAIAIAIALSLASSPLVGDAQSPSVTTPKAALTVTANVAQQVQWPVTIRASGQIAAWQEAIVSSRSNGLPLTAVNVDVGQRVHKGDVLARFDDRTARAELAQTQANLAQANASANQANLNRDRMVALRGTGAVSDESILQAETQAETSRTQVAVARANVDAAKVKIENTLVVAPDSGQIVARNATLGQAFGASTELFRLIRQNRLEWRAEVAANELPRIAVGQTAEINLPDGAKLTGRVRQTAPALISTSRLGLVHVDVKDNGSAKLAMFAEGTIQTGTATAIAVATDSVVIRDGRSFVFALEGERVKRVAVTTGRRQGGLIEIVQGVAAGQRIVVRGAGFLSDGDRVVVATAASIPNTGSTKP
jgi:RND family efflux transporter MFP subunit